MQILSHYFPISLSSKSKPFLHSNDRNPILLSLQTILPPVTEEPEAIRLRFHEFRPARPTNVSTCASTLPVFSQKIRSPLVLVQIKFSVVLVPCSHLFKESEPLIFHPTSRVMVDLSNTLLSCSEPHKREGYPWSLPRGNHVLYYTDSWVLADWTRWAIISKGTQLTDWPED